MKIWMVLQNEFLTHCSCGTHKNKSLAWQDMGLYFIVFTGKKDKSQMVDHPYSIVLMKNNFISVPVRYYYKNKSGLFWIFRLWLLKKLPIFLTPMPLSCRCSHHISIRITNSEFSRIFTKTESFEKTNQTKIDNSFLMKRCGEQQNLQKMPCYCLSIIEFDHRQFIRSGINSEFSRIFTKTESL